MLEEACGQHRAERIDRDSERWEGERADLRLLPAPDVDVACLGVWFGRPQFIVLGLQLPVAAGLQVTVVADVDDDVALYAPHLAAGEDQVAAAPRPETFHSPVTVALGYFVLGAVDLHFVRRLGARDGGAPDKEPREGDHDEGWSFVW